jgi:hypothetical protein
VSPGKAAKKVPGAKTTQNASPAVPATAVQSCPRHIDLFLDKVGSALKKGIVFRNEHFSQSLAIPPFNASTAARLNGLLESQKHVASAGEMFVPTLVIEALEEIYDAHAADSNGTASSKVPSLYYLPSFFPATLHSSLPSSPTFIPS